MTLFVLRYSPRLYHGSFHACHVRPIPLFRGTPVCWPVPQPYILFHGSVYAHRTDVDLNAHAEELLLPAPGNGSTLEGRLDLIGGC